MHFIPRKDLHFCSFLAFGLVLVAAKVLLQQRAQHLRATWLARSRRRWSRLPTSLIEDPRTWGLVGGQLDWEEVLVKFALSGRKG